MEIKYGNLALAVKLKKLRIQNVMKHKMPGIKRLILDTTFKLNIKSFIIIVVKF